MAKERISSDVDRKLRIEADTWLRNSVLKSEVNEIALKSELGHNSTSTTRKSQHASPISKARLERCLPTL